ncbi:PREDICTED: ATP synthase subunit O, mitochondrial [Nicrophorus vespilloides]|uniref:Oligomycin sensitivity conferral protein n=1 Tax=Nicrophorus vespilloides TaxID=110193 RepID=A0ABM1NGZ2_NICVS|nr:PREDICTED: ATP synthase subunit O, mitochondrial [Nicrophorus vespilloides]
MASNKLSMIVRQLSTSNANQQLVKAPIQVFGIEGRYATALYSAASKQKTLDAVEKDLIKFQDQMKVDGLLFEFIMNPTIKRKLKAEALKSVSSKMSMKQETSNLLQCLAENGRLKKVNNVINHYKLMMSAHRGEVHCEVTTAAPMEPAQRQKLEAVLKTFLKSSETALLSTKVDPTILGGMVVSIGDRYVDMSVSKKIKKYTELISATV